MPDVLIIGAGIVGCAVADELTRRGAEVMVLDPRGICQGASQASAGMLAPFSEGRHDPVMLALGARSLQMYDAFVDRIRSDGHQVGYARNGSLDVALDEPGAEMLQATARELERDGVACTWLNRPMLAREEPALTTEAAAGLRVAAHGAVAVAPLVESLWNAAEKRGAQLRMSGATAISPGHGTVRVQTDDGPIDAPHVVLAAGSWAGRISLPGGASLPVKPVRGQLLALGWRSERLRQTVWGPGCYAVPWDDGTVLVGATVEDAGFDEVATVDGVTSLGGAMTRLVPGAGRAAVVEVRVGLRPGSPDDRPIIGPSSLVEGLVYATGHFRNGALLAPLTARAVADLVGGTALDPVLAPCAPGRLGEY